MIYLDIQVNARILIEEPALPKQKDQRKMLPGLYRSIQGLQTYHTYFQACTKLTRNKTKATETKETKTITIIIESKI